MSEYIDRAALKQELAPYEENDFSKQMDVILAIVDAQPAADVAEVRHGRWEKFSTASGIISRVRCSVFSGTQPLTFESMLYCPKCGARMDKGDEIYG